MMIRELAEAVASSTISTQIKSIQDGLTRKGVENVGAAGVASKEFVAAVNAFLSAKGGKPATPGQVAKPSVPTLITHLISNANSVVNPGDEAADRNWLGMAYSLQWYATHIENEAQATSDPDAKSVLANKSMKYGQASKAILASIKTRVADDSKFAKLCTVPEKLLTNGPNPMRDEYLRKVKSDKEEDVIAGLNRKSSV